MAHVPLLCQPDLGLYLIHCEVGDALVDAELLVVDAYAPAGWIPVASPKLYGEESMLIQLPVEVIGQRQRYKGFSLRIPFRSNDGRQRRSV